MNSEPLISAPFSKQWNTPRGRRCSSKGTGRRGGWFQNIHFRLAMITRCAESSNSSYFHLARTGLAQQKPDKTRSVVVGSGNGSRGGGRRVHSEALRCLHYAERLAFDCQKSRRRVYSAHRCALNFLHGHTPCSSARRRQSSNSGCAAHGVPRQRLQLHAYGAEAGRHGADFAFEFQSAGASDSARQIVPDAVNSSAASASSFSRRRRAPSAALPDDSSSSESA